MKVILHWLGPASPLGPVTAGVLAGFVIASPLIAIDIWMALRVLEWLRP